MREPPTEPTPELVAQLEKTTLFGGLDRQLLGELSRHMETLRLAPGEILFRQSDTDGALYVVLEGRLEASRLDEGGQREVLGTIGPGEPAGEIQVLTALAVGASPTGW